MADAPDTVEVEAAEDEVTAEAVSPETALAWLASVRAPALLAVLREPDFAHVSVSAFAGFRVNPTGYANPLVRGRLAQEIRRNDKFADRVKALIEQAPARPPAPTPEVRPPAPIKPNSGGVGQENTGREEELRAERDRRRRERDEARETLRRSEQGRTQVEKALAVAEGARDAQEQLSQQQGQRIARLERQIARMQSEQAALLKALRQDKVSSPPRPSTSHSAPSPQESGNEGPNLWREAVSHLLHKGKHETVLVMAQDVLRADPGEASALEIAGLAWERKGGVREAAAMARQLLAVRLARGEITASADVLARLLLLLPTPDDARRDVRQWLAHLHADDGEAMTAGRDALERLRALSPASHAWLAAEIAAAAPALADVLMPPPGALGPDDPLPSPFPQRERWTAQRLIHAVNTGAEAAVTTARNLLAALSASDSETAERVWAALARASAPDDSALVPLRRAPRGPVVVDGSNAAWFDQHSYTTPRARLGSLLGLRRALRRRGYFPVILLADAPLPYTIDDPAALRALLACGEIGLVDGGTDADEVLLREAKLRQAPLVTNDYMTDWDPHNEVTKIQYTISPTGEAHLLS